MRRPDDPGLTAPQSTIGTGGPAYKGNARGLASACGHASRRVPAALAARGLDSTTLVRGWYGRGAARQPRPSARLPVRPIGLTPEVGGFARPSHGLTTAVVPTA